MLARIPGIGFIGGQRTVDRFDRIYRLHRILRSSRYPVSRRTLEERLECSRATVNRTIEDLRDLLWAPLRYDRRRNGYHYDERDGEHPYELPGLWFNASELHALLATQELLAGVEPGLLDGFIAPLRKRIEHLLASEHLSQGEVSRRVRILSMASRATPPDSFTAVAGALMQRRRLSIVYHGRGSDAVTERAVSPQRLTHYRDNWYLDAWCHTRRGLRSFSLDRIRKARDAGAAAVDIDDKRLDRHLASAYGIFSGVPGNTAVLLFSPERARWVAAERWHRDQRSRFHEDGSYELRVPYNDPRELLMDILKYGSDVEVMRPASLRREIRARLAAAVARYGRG